MSKLDIAKRVISCVLLLFALSFIINFIVQRSRGETPVFLGFTSAIVVSGSMEPSIPVGSYILVHEQKDYAVDDVIMYDYPALNRTVTHRIVGVTDTAYITRGDANDTNDPDVSKDAVIGKVLFHIPHGRAVIIGLSVLLAALIIFIPFPSKKSNDGTEIEGA